MGGRTEHNKNGFYFKSHVSVAFEASQLRPSLQNSLYKEAFEIGQLAQTSLAASALLKMTARLGTNNTISNLYFFTHNSQSHWITIRIDPCAYVTASSFKIKWDV